ncbi:hypothetical protein C8R44DRAFT_735144 [Mycena epipterygia]|nr:hypothetical protein C8R44DRAFT_735144 [Mycena epipterygia]
MLSDVGNVSSVSGGSGGSSSNSVESASFSDIEDSFFITQEQMILNLMAEIETTRVSDPMPRIPKASQLHLLDEWRALDHLNFCKKLCVEPDVFDGLHELIKDHMRQTGEQKTLHCIGDCADMKPVDSSNLPFPQVTLRSEEREKKTIT